jgi:hypothetical protein
MTTLATAALVMVGWGLAAQGTGAALLADAEAARRAGLWARCLEATTAALGSGRLDGDGVANARFLQGACLLGQGDEQRAARAFKIAAALLPSLRGDDETALWQAVRQEVAQAGWGLSLALDVVPVLEGPSGMGDTGGPDVLLARIDDPLGLAAAALVLDADDRELTRQPLPPAAAGAAGVAGGAGDGAGGAVARFAGLPLIDDSCPNLFCQSYSVVLVDSHGNRLRRQRSGDGGSGRAVADAAARPPGWLSYVGGAAVAVGLVGSGVAFFGISSAGQAAPQAGLDATGPWLGALAVTGGLVVVGAALLLVDQGL